MSVDKETKQFWKENARPLFWTCPRCDDEELVQYRGDDSGHALCPECLTVYSPSWDVVEDVDDLPIDE